jgi:biotin synthase
MTVQDIKSVLDKVYGSDIPDLVDLEYLLALEDEQQMESLFEYADAIRSRFVGDGILLRGLIEFSNFCRSTCFYCGLNKHNKKLQRYRLGSSQIMSAVNDIAAAGIKTVVLQSGEDADLDPYWLEELLVRIKSNFDIAVTLCVGERSYEDYKLWKQAGADRYLLKIETADKTLYDSLHTQMSFENRVECSRNLKALGYQNGSGCLVGLKGQTIRSLAEDILFFKKEEFDMLGIGLFIPHEMTPLKNEPLGNIKLALKVIAVTRIVTKDTNIPATTAIGSIGKSDARILALKAGANVLMPNFTPQPYKRLYEIYPGKRCVNEQGDECVHCIETMAKTINRSICYSRGDSLKKGTHAGVLHN